MPDNRARIWFALFVLVIFCLGGAGGFLVGRRLPPGPLQGFGPGRLDNPDGPGPNGFRRGGSGPGGRRGGPPFGRGPGGPPLPPDLLENLSRAVDLDATQRDRVEKLLAERRDRFEQVQREARDRFEAEQRALHAAIRTVLRPDQQPKFDQFLQRRPR